MLSPFLAISRYLLLSPFISWSIRGIRADMDETYIAVVHIDAAVSSARTSHALASVLSDLARDRAEMENRYTALQGELDRRIDRYEELRLNAIRALEGASQ
jgi:hypothetical protein